MAGKHYFVILAILAANVWAVYFPMRTINITLPDVGSTSKPLPPVLTLTAHHSSKSDVTYVMDGGNQFYMQKDQVRMREDRTFLPKTGHQQLKVFAEAKDEKTASATINIVFSGRKLVCEDMKREMCFWSDGRYQLTQDEPLTVMGHLSSEFLLGICSNYTVTYQILSGGDHFEVRRMSNTNANSWVLSPKEAAAAADEATVRSEISCSVTADDTQPTVYRKGFEVDIVGNPSGKRVPLEIMSLVVPEEETDKVALTYPESVEVSRFAAIASRVTDPRLVPPDDVRRVVDSGIKFRIEPDDVFGITEEGGIVYVRDPSPLRNATSFSVRIIWMHPKGIIADKRTVINVADNVSACEGKISDTRSRKSCSQRTSESDCLKTCGVGTGLLTRNAAGVTTSGCQWRNNERPEDLSTSFRTCSPNLMKCPDRFCDPLEALFRDVCPQDCAGSVYGSANKELSQPGISSASGVCSCSPDGETCTCSLLDSKKRQAANSEQCGMACLSSVVGGTVILIFAISTFFMILYHRRLKKRCPNQEPLKEDMININYEEYIDRSADGLRIPPHNPILYDKPDYYDKKWEFPRYRLAVEETIGEGEFGKVLKARAEGIGGIDGPTVVAVKTLKENARDSELNDLISEYQLLKEVDHPNIIRLLGACTTLDGPLYIIIEYAKHGSLRNYLRRNRHLGSELLLNKESETSYMQSITPKDILTFAWQIAKGMAYLTEMKLVHRDLAARNVLIGDGLICKISDFGLTRDIYEDDTYLKRSKGRVPVKWMALESLSDHLYTTKSDVWSYGIVLWELVTTGASPYPGIAVQNLFHLLKSGYRMERPINCSPELYQILRSCWHENPNHRPTFKSLVSKLEEMLGEGKDYLDLNPRIIENKTYFSDFPGEVTEEEEEEEEAFLPGNPIERGAFKWRFDFSEGDCGCPTREYSFGEKLRYENESVGRKPNYENDGVEDSSYVQPKEPKPVNSVMSPNLYECGEEKKCESKKI